MNKEYLIQFLVGGILFVLIYHFSKKRNTIISSILPALPIVFFTGFIYLTYFQANVLNYVRNCIFTFGCDIIFFTMFYLLVNTFTKNIFLSLILSLIIYILLLYSLVKNNILI